MSDKQARTLTKLFNLGCFKEGNFTLKSGEESSFYLDFRMLVSYPKLLVEVCDLIYHKMVNTPGKICGLPYAGMPYSQTISVCYNRPIVMLRKEQKKHGTGKMIEGEYSHGEDLIIIDDILTKGTSILESLEHLKGFNIKKIIVLVDREQGGSQKLKDMGYIVESVFTLSNFMGMNSLVNCKLYPSINPMVKEVKKTIMKKKSNICISMDLTTTEEIIVNLLKLKDHIMMIKLHCDIIENFNEVFVKKLVEICEENNIFIFEDRKFSDIGATFKKQFTGGIYKIKSWCNITNFHSLVGEGILEQFGKLRNKNQGGLLIAQMSNQGNLLDDVYMKKTVEMAKKYRDDIIGFICQKKIGSCQMLHIVPGISLEAKDDGADQRYTSPYMAMVRGADILIVGRAIMDKSDIIGECEKYRKIGWDCYEKKNIF
jgi:uridine monophosphate synthetase